MLKRGNWSVTELIKLRQSYGRRPLRLLAAELRRTPTALRQRAEQLFAGKRGIGEPTAHALPIHNVFRDDVPTEPFDPAQALANAPQRDGSFFGVPKVLDQGSGE